MRFYRLRLALYIGLFASGFVAFPCALASAIILYGNGHWWIHAIIAIVTPFMMWDVAVSFERLRVRKREHDEFAKWLKKSHHEEWARMNGEEAKP